MVKCCTVLRLIKFPLLFYFPSSDLCQMVNGLERKPLMRYHVYPRLKTVIKKFQNKCNMKCNTLVQN